MARPIPEPEPVTTAMWFCRSPGIAADPCERGLKAA
jgi:hypothetical protein